MTDHPFWTFSLDRYGREGVPPLCLILQDRHGADVNLVLFGLWLGSQGRRIRGVPAAVTIGERVADWHAQIVRPLRGVRRAMKGWPIRDEAARDSLRARLQAVEIESERLEQEMLYDGVASAEMDGLWDNDQTSGPAVLMARNAAYFCRPADDGVSPSDTLRRLVGLCL